MGDEVLASSNLETIKPGNHVCSLFNDGEELVATARRFARAGLGRNEKVICIQGKRDRETEFASILSVCEPEERAAAKKGLALMVPEEVCIRNGRFDSGEMLAWLEERTDEALSEGYGALRVVVDMGWALKEVEGTDCLIEYEHRINSLASKDRNILLCQYDMKRFHPMILLGILNAHPKILLRGELLDNYYHVEEEDFAVEDYPKIALEKYLGSLRAFHANIKAVLGFGEATDGALAGVSTGGSFPENILENYYSRGLSHLSRAASRFVDVRLEDDLWRLIGEELKGIAGDCFIIVNSFDEEAGEASIRAVIGDRDVIDKAVAMIGRDPSSIRIRVEEKIKEISLRGELARFPGGLFELSEEFVPRRLWEVWSESFGLGEVYGISFTNRGELLGGAVIVTREETSRLNRALIEAFAHLAAIAVQRRRAEMGLRESERRYRDIFENIGEGVALVDEEETIIFSNPAGEEIFGVEPGGLTGRNLRDFTDAENYAILRAQTGLRKAGRKSNYELEIVRPDGEHRAISVMATPRVGEGSRYIGSFGVFRDVTYRQTIFNELRESEERFRTLAQTANDAVIVCDEEGIISFWNKGAREIFGYREEEILGKSVRKLMPPEKREAYTEGLKRAGPSGELQVVGRMSGGHGARMDGSIFPFELSVASWETQAGKFYTGIIRDITWRREMERELQARNEELGAFAHSVSHDLQGSLAVIEGFSLSALHAEEQGDKEIEKESLEHVVKAARRMEHYIVSLLEYATARRPEAKVTEVDLEEVLLEVFNDLEQDIKEKGVEVVIAGDLPSIAGSPIKLKQVLMNLIGNAIKHMRDNPEPRIEVGAMKEKGKVTMFVRDNGIGIPADKLEEIFLPFERLGAERTRGLGIGLATVRRAVEAWGGEAWAESSPGEGAAFFFTVPETG